MDSVSGRLAAAAAARPGACTRELAVAAGTSESNASYHLQRLADEGALLREGVGRAACWYSVGCGFCPILRRAVPILGREAVGAVARAITESPETAPSIAARAGVDVGAARWAIGVLEGAFLVERSPRGRVWLREGAAHCVGMASEGRRCDLWGRCPVSLAFQAARR